MKIVIQCAARKDPNAGTMRTNHGKPVLFVAKPTLAPADDTLVYAKPDDEAEDGKTWRDKLLIYSRHLCDNPLELLPAYRLYRHDAYRALVDKYGEDNVYILSAGWGLIPAWFLTPQYDITFSQNAELYKRRRKTDTYDDFQHVPDDGGEPLVFFGGKDYLPLFNSLTEKYNGARVAFYNSKQTPDFSGVELIRFKTTRRTNWHYSCVKAFINGDIVLP